MSVVEQNPFNEHVGNGVTSVFGYTFQLLDADDLKVYLDGVLQPTSIYSVSGIGNQAGGDVTFTPGNIPASGVVVLLSREIQLARDTDYQYAGELREATLDEDFNRLWQALQGQRAILNGAVRAPYPETMTPLPAQAARANQFLVFDASGNLQVSAGTGADAGLRADLADTTNPANGAALVGFNPTLNYVAATLGARNAEIVSPKDHPWLAKGDNSTIDRAAIEACFTYAASTGKKVFVPPGVYLLDNTVAWPIASGFEVECAPGAIFKATAAVPVDAKLFFPTATSGSQRFKWVGGFVDGRLLPPRNVGAPDLLYINSPNIKFVHIEASAWVVNNDRSGNAGDSCLFLAEGEDYYVHRNYFQGAVDAGIYLSGDSTETLGRRAIIGNNIFIECGQVGVISKRQFQEHVIDGNIVDRCGVGIVMGGEADATRLPGKRGAITGNRIRRVTRGIEIKVSDGAVVTGNSIEDWGINAAGTSVNDVAISVRGSKACVVVGNSIRIDPSITPASGATAIRCNRFTWGGADYDSTANLIGMNNIVRTGVAFAEDANSNNNKWLDNNATDYLTLATLNSNTLSRFVGWEGTRQINYFGDSGAGPVSTADAFWEKNGELIFQYCVPNTNTIQWLVGDQNNNAVGRFGYSNAADRWFWRANGSPSSAMEMNEYGPIIRSFTVANLPTTGVAAGLLAYASNGRKAGEGAGAGTGVLVFRDGANWIAVDTGAPVTA